LVGGLFNGVLPVVGLLCRGALEEEPALHAREPELKAGRWLQGDPVHAYQVQIEFPAFMEILLQLGDGIDVLERVFKLFLPVVFVFLLFLFQ
jgi:hypothetical protein